MGWRKAAFNDDVPGWRRRAVTRGKRRGRWPVVALTDRGRWRRGRLQIRRPRWWIPMVRRTDGDVASWSRWRRGSLWLVSRGRGESKRGIQRPCCGSRERKREEVGVSVGAPHGEEEEGVPGTRGMKDTGRGPTADGGRWRQRDAIAQSGGRGGVGC
jgi:hypothetical protein